MTISGILADGEREIRVADSVAYGEVAEDGETYALAHAPTQEDYDIVAEWLDAARPHHIIAAMKR
jgi:hypothetical protein